MSARERILQRIALARAQQGLARPRPVHCRPDVPVDRVERFCVAVAKAAATWEVVADVQLLVERVTAYRAAHRLSGPTAVAPALGHLDWPDDLTVEVGTTNGDAVLAVSRAMAGIAETGTLVIASGPATPTRLNFLPDHHLVLLDRSAILTHMEDALAVFPPHQMPRAVNLVTGPSRTADVEQTLQLGAHGPRCLHVLLLETDMPFT